MGRSLVEKVIVPALEALRDPKEQVYLGLTLATLLVLLFGPGGVTTGSQANQPGIYTGTSSNGVFAQAKPNTSVVQPGPISLNPVDKRPINLPQVEPEAPMPYDPAKAKPTTPVIEPGPKQPKPVGPLSEFKLQEEPKPAMPR